MDKLINEYYIKISKVDESCSIAYFWNLFAADVTIFGFFAGLILLEWEWFQTPFRIGCFIAGFLLLVLTISLCRWICSLVKCINHIKQIASKICTEAANLRENHQALSKEYDKMVDQYGTLQSHYSMVTVLVDFFVKGQLSAYIESLTGKSTEGGIINALESNQDNR